MAALENQWTNAHVELMMDDDSTVSNCEVAANLMRLETGTIVVRSIGDCPSDAIVAIGEAESLDLCVGEAIITQVKEGLECGKHKCKANKLYIHSFWLSHDD